MQEFEINGEQYRSKKLTAFQQFHIARRLSPLLLSLGPGENRLASFGQALAAMTDADGEYVIGLCMGVVERFNKESKVWAPAWHSVANRAMFAELNDFATLMPIVMKVIEDNLGNFLNALPTALSIPETARQA